MEKLTVALAEIVHTGHSIFVANETVFRTLSMTGKKVWTFLTLAWQLTAFQLGKVMLLGGIHHLGDALLVKISQTIFWKDEMVAGIDIAVELHDSGMTALFAKYTDSRRFAYPVR